MFWIPWLYQNCTQILNFLFLAVFMRLSHSLIKVEKLSNTPLATENTEAAISRSTTEVEQARASNVNTRWWQTVETEVDSCSRKAAEITWKSPLMAWAGLSFLRQYPGILKALQSRSFVQHLFPFVSSARIILSGNNSFKNFHFIFKTYLRFQLGFAWLFFFSIYKLYKQEIKIILGVWSLQ